MTSGEINLALLEEADLIGLYTQGTGVLLQMLTNLWWTIIQ